MTDFLRRLLRGSSLRTIHATGAARPAPRGAVVGIGQVVDLGDGNEAVGIADPTREHGIRVEIRSKT